MEEIKPIIIKFKPYTGLSDENNAQGKLTKVLLYSDRMEYDVNYIETVTISMNSEISGEKTKESIRYIEEFGIVEKQTISNLVKYIKTEYTLDGEPYKIYVVDVANSAVQLTFEIELEEDRNKLFNALMKWKYGK